MVQNKNWAEKNWRETKGGHNQNFAEIKVWLNAETCNVFSNIF